MRIYVKLKDDQRVTVKYQNLPSIIRQAVYVKALDLAARLKHYIVDTKLSGQVLHRKSGKLVRSIRVKVEKAANQLLITASTNSPYGRIHEKGGTIPAHMVYPSSASVLRFLKGGDVVFASKTLIPAVRMPKRPFLEPSMREMASTITLELKEALVQAIIRS